MVTLRQIQMLQLIPSKEPGISARELHEKLDHRGYSISLRTVQRDLETLSLELPLVDSLSGRTKRWFWMRDASITQFPIMDTQTALTFRLVEAQIAGLLPPGVRRHLQRHFDLAVDTLCQEHAEAQRRWADRVRVISGDQPLIIPEPEQAVTEIIYQALLDRRTFQGAYVARDRQPNEARIGIIHPLGLVYRGPIAYLIARRDEESVDLVKQFALHRFNSATPDDTPLVEPGGFDVDAYIAEGNLLYPEGALITLELRVHRSLARILQERLLSDNQRIDDDSERGRDWRLLTATVQETAQLRWWLLSFGNNLEVLGPAAFRQRIGSTIMEMASWYCRDQQPGPIAETELTGPGSR